MDMRIEIPSGRILLNGHKVESLKRSPYIMVNGIKSHLSEDEKKMARAMTKAFLPLIEKKQDYRED